MKRLAETVVELTGSASPIEFVPYETYVRAELRGHPAAGCRTRPPCGACWARPVDRLAAGDSWRDVVAAARAAA